MGQHFCKTENVCGLVKRYGAAPVAGAAPYKFWQYIIYYLFAARLRFFIIAGMRDIREPPEINIKNTQMPKPVLSSV